MLLVAAAIWGLWSRRGERAPGELPATPAKPAGSHLSLKLAKRYQIKDPKTGQVTTYNSLEDIPPEFRAAIERAEANPGSVTTQTKISVMKSGGGTKVTVTDAAGVPKTYDSIDDMPPDVRALYERAIKELPG